MDAALRRLGRPWEIVVFGQVPAIAFLWLVWAVYGHGGGGDFAIFRRAGQAVLHGHSPYVNPTLKLLAANDRFVYPTPFALPFVPFAVVPEKAAAVAFLALSVAAVLASVWLLGVRDWRCYGASLLGLPVLGALGVGSIGPFLLLLCALGWRFRDRTVAGVPLALAAAAKLFLWPVLVWLLVTRRFRAFVASLGTIVVILALWASIDSGGMSRYPQTVRLLNDVISLHVSALTSELVSGAAALAAIVALVLLRHRRDDVTFSAAVVSALIATPILWNHYLVVLLAPIALARPRLAPLWLLPLLLLATPHPESLGIVWRIVFVLAVLALVAIQTVRRSSTQSLTEGLAGLARSGADAPPRPI
ncbi:MAG: glycosyltransferase family 87 protein [Gaiellaceae bacterium]